MVIELETKDFLLGDKPVSSGLNPARSVSGRARRSKFPYRQRLAADHLNPMSEKCGIKHGHGGQPCNRKRGHDGLCRSKSERGAGGTITYSEWESKGGVFQNHVGYRT